MENEKLNLESLNEVTGGTGPMPRQSNETEEQYKKRMEHAYEQMRKMREDAEKHGWKINF